MRKSQTKSGRRSLRIAAVAVAASAAVLAAPALPASAATALSTTQVASTGSTLYITGGTALASTQAIRYALSSNACPTPYYLTPQAGAVNGGLITAISTGVAYVQTPALVAGTTYKPCLYVDASTSGTTGIPVTTDALSTNITAMTGVAPLSPSNAQPADKINLNVAGAPFTLTSYAAEFFASTSSCPATYTTTVVGSILASAVSKTSASSLSITVPATVVAATPYLVCVYNGTAGTNTLQGRGLSSFVSYDKTLPTAIVAPTGGNSGILTTITLTASSAVYTGTPVALIARNGCPLTYAASSGDVEPYDALVTKISTTKLAVTVPITTVVSGADVNTPWNICTYASSAGGALVTSPAIYNAAQALDVTTGPAVISPAQGPASGGSTITVTGVTGIPTVDGATLTATLGGNPITGIKALGTTSFTGTTGYHAPGAVKLAVTTSAGTKTTTTTPYSYSYGIQVSPSTAPTAADQTLDIVGAGFAGLVWDATIAGGGSVGSGKANVFLTDNGWNATTWGGAVPIIVSTTVLPKAQCAPVLPISDSEVVCTLKLTSAWTGGSAAGGTATISGNVAAGTYSISVVNDDLPSDALSERSVVSSGATFTVAPF